MSDNPISELVKDAWNNDAGIKPDPNEVPISFQRIYDRAATLDHRLRLAEGELPSTAPLPPTDKQWERDRRDAFRAGMRQQPFPLNYDLRIEVARDNIKALEHCDRFFYRPHEQAARQHLHAQLAHERVDLQYWLSVRREYERGKRHYETTIQSRRAGSFGFNLAALSALNESD